MATNIIGRGLSGLLKYIKIKAEESGLKNILNKLPEEDKAVFSKKISPAEWYPFRIYVELLALIDKELGNGDLSICRDIGEWSAERDLKAVYMYYTKDTFRVPQMLKTAPSVMWKGYYDKGDLMFQIPESIAAPEVSARIVDFPDAAKPNCALLGGWIKKVFEIIIGGGWECVVTEVKCRADGEEYCEFIVKRTKWGDDAVYKKVMSRLF